MSDYWNRWQQRRFGRRGFIASAGATGIGAAALGIVGCGGDDDDSGDSGSSGDGGTGTSTATEVSIDDLRNMSLERSQLVDLVEVVDLEGLDGPVLVLGEDEEVEELDRAAVDEGSQLGGHLAAEVVRARRELDHEVVDRS